MRKCCLKGCGSVGVRCFGLPSDKVIRKLWLDWILSVNGVVPKNVLICERHFRDEDKGKVKLKKGSVPCIFEPGLPGELQVSSYELPAVCSYEVSSITEIYVVEQKETVICGCTTFSDKHSYTGVCTVQYCAGADAVTGLHNVNDEVVVDVCTTDSFSSVECLETGMVDMLESSVVQKSFHQTEQLGVDVCIIDPVPSVECLEPCMVDMAEISVVQNSCDQTEQIDVAKESSTSICAQLKKRVQRRCSVNGCSNDNTTSSLYALPRVNRIINGTSVVDDVWMTRCVQWRIFCGNQKLFDKDIASLHKHFYICNSHFASDAFNGKQLKKNAMPTLFGHAPMHDAGIVDSDCLNASVDEPLSSDFIAGRGVCSPSRLDQLKALRNRKFTKKFEDIMKSFTRLECSLCKEKYMYYRGMKRVHRGRKSCLRFSVQNNMDPGVVPPELQGLTFIEEQLIARVHPILCVFKLKGLQYGYKGNVINFSQDVHGFANQLPHRIDNLSSVLTIRFQSNSHVSSDFQVRAKKVRDALKWLKEHNPYYHNIEISSENLDKLPEDGDVSAVVNSLVINSDDDGDSSSEEDVDSDADTCKVTSSGVPLATFTNQNDQIKSVLNWPEMDQDPVNEFTPGLIVCAFPTLFPFGNCDLHDERENVVKMHEYFKHLLSFGDDRFAKHKTFRFFALNMWMRHTALTNGNVFINMDSELSGMNVGQLKDRIKDNPSMLNKIMFMGTNLKGSKSYWKSRCGELKDMVEQIGLPTLFLTMSAADMYWPDLFRLLADKDVSELSMRERRILIQENPLIVDMFFQYRLECFLENVLIPKYGVVDYWYRIEYQHRGSPHLHGLFWLQNAPDVSKYEQGSEVEKAEIVKYFDDLVCAILPEVDVIEGERHCCETLNQDVEDVEKDLCRLVRTVQMHKCSKGYCQRIDKKTKRSYCRFHFPMDICQCAKIDLKNDTEELEFIPERNHDKVNKFNPFILATWRANIDIAPVLSKRAILEYLAKYVSKSEIRSASLQEICNAVCSSLNETDKAKRAVHKILMKNCVERDISAQEVCHLLMGLKLHSAGGRSFVIVYTNAKKWVPVGCAEENNVEFHGNQCGSRGKTFLEKYADRPVHLHRLSMWEVAKFYNTKWSKLEKPNIVRVFPRLKLSADEDKNEEYYRQKVLLHVPWSKETELTMKTENESWRDVYNRHLLGEMNIDELNFNIPVCDNSDLDCVDDEENVNVMNEDWMIASRLGIGRQPEEIELGRREVDAQFDWIGESRKYDCYGDLKYFKGFIESEKKNVSHGNVMSSIPEVTFSPEQDAVRKLMEEQIAALKIDTPCHVPKRVLVQGKAGTGKSLLIRYLVAKLQQEFGDGSFLLLGPTGVAAVNIGGATIHSVLKIPRKIDNFKPLIGETARTFSTLLEKVKFVIIDEYSMIGCKMLGMIDKRFREGTGINEPFGSLNVYFFGDIRQLPPVKDVSLFSKSCFNELAQHGQNVFKSFERHMVLTQGHRQSDANFQAMLDRLSVGEVSNEDYNMMKQRFSSSVSREVLNSFSDAIRLFSTKEEVKNYNDMKLKTLKDENGNLLPVARLPAKHNGKGACSATADQADGLESVLYLSRGTRIMLKSNLWVQKGLVNGSTGVVVDLFYSVGQDPSVEPPSIVFCKFPDYVGPGIGPDNLVPIGSVLRSFSMPSGMSCSRQQFPLVVCYACSIHKSQGLTLNQAVIDIGKREFSLGLTYVGMSRVKSLSGLLLIPFSYERLMKIKCKPDLVSRKCFEKDVLKLL